jgi:hypothetical protein
MGYGDMVLVRETILAYGKPDLGVDSASFEAKT